MGGTENTAADRHVDRGELGLEDFQTALRLGGNALAER
jgi:hypothetical protein